MLKSDSYYIIFTRNLKVLTNKIYTKFVEQLQYHFAFNNTSIYESTICYYSTHNL